MLEIKQNLNDTNGNEIFALWMEYEEQSSYESKFIKALYKLEAFIQHNEAKLESWEYQEKKMLFENKWLIDYCAFDSFLLNLRRKLLMKV